MLLLGGGAFVALQPGDGPAPTTTDGDVARSGDSSDTDDKPAPHEGSARRTERRRSSDTAAAEPDAPTGRDADAPAAASREGAGSTSTGSGVSQAELDRHVATLLEPALEELPDWDSGVAEGTDKDGPLRLEARAFARETGRPLADAVVIVELNDGSRLHGTTNTVGRIAFPHPGAQEEVWVRIEHPGRIAIVDDDAAVTPGRTQVFEARMLAGVPIVGRITDAETGMGIAGAEVLVLGHWAADDPLSEAKDIHVAGRATSDTDGSYELHALEALGHEEGRISAPGYGSVLVEVRPPTLQDAPLRLDAQLVPGATATGTVLDPDGEPASGALVLAIPADFAADEEDPQPAEVYLLRSIFELSVEPPLLHTYADASGTFELRGLRRDAAYIALAIREEDGCSRAAEIAPPGGPTADLPPLQLRRPATVVVHIVDTSGAPIADGDVMLDPGWRVQFQESPVGTFSCDVVDPGPRRGIVEVPGRPDTPFRFEAHPGQTTELTVTVGGGITLTGRVIDSNGGAVSGAEVTTSRFGDSDAADVWVPVWTDSDGAFVVEGLAPGVYDVDVEHQEFVETEVSDLEVPAGELTITMERAAWIRIELILPEGAPEPTETTVMADHGDAESAYRWRWLGAVYESWKGVIKRSEVKPGPRRIQVIVPGYRTIIVSADLAPGEVHDFGKVKLLPPFALTGIVVDASGAPLPGARILTGGDVWSVEAPGEVEAAATSGADGLVEFTLDTPGENAIAATAGGYATTVLRIVPADDAAPLRFVLERGTLVCLHMRGPDGAPLVASAVSLEPSGSGDGDGDGDVSWHRSVRTDSAGRIEIRLVAGQYEWRAGEMADAIRFTVSPADDQTLELQIPATGD